MDLEFILSLSNLIGELILVAGHTMLLTRPRPSHTGIRCRRPDLQLKCYDFIIVYRPHNASLEYQIFFLYLADWHTHQHEIEITWYKVPYYSDDIPSNLR